MSTRVSTCPQCHFDTSILPDDISFCPRCRFPLILVARKYQLERKLAEGGFGLVYRAHHVVLDTQAKRAIKVFRPEIFDVEGMAERFQREVRVTASLSEKSEHIVRIYDDFGYQEGMGYFYVMEYLEGITLEQWLRRQGHLDLPALLDIIHQTCLGMRAAHQARIVHRDLKPSNLFLIRRESRDPFVKIIDFGIVKLLSGTHQTQATKGLLGTPSYMAPEQCINAGVDIRTDIYALGIILYEMLTGRPPFVAEPDQFLAVIHAHLSQTPAPLQQHKTAAHVPQALDDVIQQALKKYPEERFSSVADFWNAIVAAVPDLSLPRMPVSSPGLTSSELVGGNENERDGVSPAEREQKIRETLSAATTSFAVRVKHDYGSGTPRLQAESATAEQPLPSGRVIPLHVPENLQNTSLAHQETVALQRMSPRHQRMRRGIMMLLGAGVVLAIMWILTEWTTPRLPTNVPIARPGDPRQRLISSDVPDGGTVRDPSRRTEEQSSSLPDRGLTRVSVTPPAPRMDNPEETEPIPEKDGTGILSDRQVHRIRKIPPQTRQKRPKRQVKGSKDRVKTRGIHKRKTLPTHSLAKEELLRRLEQIVAQPQQLSQAHHVQEALQHWIQLLEWQAKQNTSPDAKMRRLAQNFMRTVMLAWPTLSGSAQQRLRPLVAKAHYLSILSAMQHWKRMPMRAKKRRTWQQQVARKQFVHRRLIHQFQQVVHYNVGPWSVCATLRLAETYDHMMKLWQDQTWLRDCGDCLQPEAMKPMIQYWVPQYRTQALSHYRAVMVLASSLKHNQHACTKQAREQSIKLQADAQTP